MWKLSNSGGIENASELKMSFASDAFIPITITESRIRASPCGVDRI